MTKTTIEMVGHGKRVVIDVGSFTGEPYYITAPRNLKVEIEQAYRSVIGDTETEGGFSWHACGKVRYLHNRTHSQSIRFSLYKVCADGIGREDVSTRRTFRFYTKRDYS